MATHDERAARLAILIDADNVSPRIAAGLFEQFAVLGEASVRRIYGDFSGTRLKGWSDLLARHAIVPNQIFANTAGKNASDIALVIDAMDLLHTGRFDAFCLVSSDGDFTRLAARIREQGVDVYGFGERKSPESFQKACKRFVCTEEFAATPESKTATPPATVKPVVPTPPVPKSPAAAATPSQVVAKHPPSAAVPLLRAALKKTQSVDGWFALGLVGKGMAESVPGFDPRSYGCAKLVTLVEKCGMFDIRRDDKQVFIQPKMAVKAA